MRKTDPRMFYELGRSLDELKRLSYATSAPEIVLALYNPNQWLSKFLAATDGEEVPLAKSREAATNLLRLVRRVNDAMLSALKKSAKESLGSDNVRCLFELLDNFEAEFAHECRELAAFIVTQKGLFSTPLLIEAAEGQFSKNQRAVMPQKTISDIQQAGRCLAFELPTACAFHVCRATEALMLEYLHL
ncbi:MAG TPA: hypothetical protein VEZ90_10760 [Blastocatellia bacterium]|nr:hypothetical protein [Blastocatellia bacterium]